MENFFKKKTIPCIDNANSPFIAKYKPYCLDHFTGNERLIEVLRSLAIMEDMNILITGGSNSGKTSFLYAIIREYYKLSRHDLLPENNIMFINSLKEQGINYYRNEMRTFCQSKCSIYGKKKLIIVDDLDLINEQCQQVFRNHIDKYKSNVHFVSVCNNIHKVIESIQSRLHIMKFHTPTPSIVEHITDSIIVNENMKIPPDVKKYISVFSNHSIREIIGHLEKIHILSNDDQDLQLPACKHIISNISQNEFEIYISFVKEAKIEEAIDVLYSIYDYGYSVIDILDMFYSFIKITHILSETQKYNVLPVLCDYMKHFHNLHEDVVEVVLLTYDLHKVLVPS
jgi:DNA polymerase III delta prime subunit